MSIALFVSLTLWVATIAGFIIYNLYQKNVKLEGLYNAQSSKLRTIQSIVAESDKVLKELDRRGIYKSDDEVGTFFATVQELQDILNTVTNDGRNLS